MDPYKVLGISAKQVQHESDIEKVRSRAKLLYKRHSDAGSKFDAKKVLEAFELVKQRLKNAPGEGQYKILGRSRKERELDKHFNHQTKEIKKNKGLKRALKQASHGTLKERIHLPGDKERIPRPRRRRHHRDRRRRGRTRRLKHTDVNVLEGLNRLAKFMPQESKFPKVIKLLYRWMKDYMNTENREYVFKVLHSVSNCTFLLDDAEVRQDVIQTFEYVLGYFTEWFGQGDERSLFSKAWQVGTVLACRCHTDDAFVLSSTIAKLSEAFAILEKHKDAIGVVPDRVGRRRAKDESKEEQEEDGEFKRSKSEVKSEGESESDEDMKSEASFGERVAKKVASNGRSKAKGGDGADVDAEPKDDRKGEVEPEVKAEVKPEVKAEVKAEAEAEVKGQKVARPLMSKPLIGMGSPAAPRAAAAPGASPTASPPGAGGASPLPSPLASPGPLPGPSPLASPGPVTLGSPSTDAGDDADDLEVLSSDSDCVDVGSDDDVLDVGSDREDDEAQDGIDIGSSQCSEAELDEVSSEGDVEEIEGSIFATPPLGQSLDLLRQHLVDRCLASLFQRRGPPWARPKIDAFFQDIFYRRSIFTDVQRMRVEDWQAKIKTSQRVGERQVGEANNPLEPNRPVVDSREMRTVLDADSNVWAAKQTFDNRESSAGKVIR